MGTRLRTVRTQVTGRGQRPISANLFTMFLVKLPQNRHPERSASPIDCVPQRLWRGVEGPRRCLFYPCCSELFNRRALTGRPSHGLSLEPRTKNLLASCYVRRLHVPETIKCVSQQIVFSGFDGRKAPNSVGKISTAEVLRLRATSAVARNQSVRRSAQDDDSVGV